MKERIVIWPQAVWIATAVLSCLESWCLIWWLPGWDFRQPSWSAGLLFHLGAMWVLLLVGMWARQKLLRKLIASDGVQRGNVGGLIARESVIPLFEVVIWFLSMIYATGGYWSRCHSFGFQFRVPALFMAFGLLAFLVIYLGRIWRKALRRHAVMAFFWSSLSVILLSGGVILFPLIIESIGKATE